MHRMLAPITALSLTLAVLPTASTSAAPSPSPRSVAPAASAGARSHVPDIVLVDASLGGRNDIEGATISALDADGNVLQTIVSGERGEAIMSREKLRGAVQLRVEGGVSEWGTPNNATLYGPVKLDKKWITVVDITPVTTLAEYVSRHRDISYGAAMRAVRTHLGIPHWAKIRHHADDPTMFGPRAFGQFAAKRGGVRQALVALERQMDSGSGPRVLIDRARQGRSVEELAGEFLFDTIFEAATGQSPGELLGSAFGVESPTIQALEQIEAQLEQIEIQLNEIQAQLTDLKNEIKTAEYYTLKTQVGDVESATIKQWGIYEAIVGTVSTTADYREFAEDFYDALNTTSAEYTHLFTDTSGTGILDSLYQMYLTQYPWWNAGDVDKMRAVVDYYGTLQAQTTTLLMEAWNFDDPGDADTPAYEHHKTSSYISTQLSAYYKPQHDKVYAAMPDSIGPTQIVNPAKQRAYTLAPYTPPLGAVGEKWRGNDTGCGSDRSSGTKVPKVTSTDVAGWWTAATPAGSSSGSNTELSFLKNTRAVTTDGATSTVNALSVVAPAAPAAWVAVSNQALPYVIWDRQTTAGLTTTWLAGWSYCDSSTSVSLVADQIPNFAMGKLMGVANQWGTNTAYVPAGQKATFTSMIPVGLLVYTAGNWRYKTS